MRDAKGTHTFIDESADPSMKVCVPFTFGRMGAADRDAAFGLFLAFLQSDPHYLEAAAAYGDGGSEAIRRALDLFVERPELGFVWMARRGGEVVGCCVACFAISTSRGSLVAKLDDVNVRPGLEGQGIGSAMMESLKAELRRAGATRIDTATHFDNPGARRFYERHGFTELREERLSCLLCGAASTEAAKG